MTSARLYSLGPVSASGDIITTSDVSATLTRVLGLHLHNTSNGALTVAVHEVAQGAETGPSNQVASIVLAAGETKTRLRGRLLPPLTTLAVIGGGDVNVMLDYQEVTS